MAEEFDEPDIGEVDLDDPLRSRLSQFQLWSSSQIANVARRPTDLLVLAACAVGLILIFFLLPDDILTGLSVNEGLANVVDSTLLIGSIALIVWSLVIVGASALSKSHRVLVVQLLIAVAIGWVFSIFFARQIDMIEVFQIGSLGAWTPSWSYTLIIPVCAAVVSAASPFVSRPARIVGRVLIGGALIGSVALADFLPTRSVALVLIAVGAGAITHLIFGTPSGGPTPGEVRQFLVSSGVDAREMEEDVVAPGIHRMRGRLGDGSCVSVNVFAYDALDSQLWGGVTSHFKNRETKSRLVRARLDQAEHAMLMTAVARQHDVPAIPVLRLLETERSDVLVVSDGYGETLVDRDMTADLARKMWSLVLGLHRAGLVHSEISVQAFSVNDDGDIAFNDLRSAFITDSTTGRLLDKVNVLALTAMGLSVDESVAIAQEILTNDELRELIPYLQKAAISNSSSAAKNVDAKELRLRVVGATGGEDVQLARIRLVDLRSIITMAVIAIIAVSLYGLLTGVDFVEILRSIRDADSQVILFAFLLAPVVQVFFAFSTLGAASRPVKYFPALMLQYAIQFIAVTMPATAARMAMNIRFFQGFGFPPVQAVSVGVIDGFSGFVVQVLFLLTIWILGLSGFTVSLTSIFTENTGRDFSGLVTIVELVLVLILLLILVALIIRRVRTFVRSILPKVREMIRDSFNNVRESFSVVRQPRKILMLLGGNAGAQVMQAIVLGICLKGFGYDASLSQLILINTLVSLFAGLMPIPGGVGVAEAGYTLCLQAIGVPADVALTTATTFRLVTFYLPPIYGFFGIRYLRKHEYV